MNRRDFLVGGLLGLASSTSVVAGSQTPGASKRTLQQRWVLAAVHIDPSHPAYRRAGCRYICWAEIDLLTGAYDVCSENHSKYSWPVANWLIHDLERVPLECRDDDFPRVPPGHPPLSSVRVVDDLIYVLDTQTGGRYVVPRYVNCTTGRDIWEGVNRVCRRDRRDDFSCHWMNVDLLNFDMAECVADDPIYDSQLASGRCLG